ncbi:MAG: hypothetical protein Q9204_000377 [Flavoplaca sp. TL-2023a]
MALDLGKEPLGAAIKAAQQGTTGSHGFKAFFKNNAAVGQVVNLLKSIQSLKSVRGLKPNTFRLSQPEFVCVQADTDPVKVCERYDAFAYWEAGYKWIFICPKYFAMKISPVGPPSKFCPRVINNEFEKSERKEALLASYQKYSLIHEMGHFYMGQHSTLGPDTEPPETYSLNGCVNMDPENSLKNPMHWQYFNGQICLFHLFEFPDAWELQNRLQSFSRITGRVTNETTYGGHNGK